MKSSPGPCAPPIPTLRGLLQAVRRCLADDKGSATTEYVVLTLVTVPLIIILFHPDNGFYKAARDQYELTTLLLRLPGP